MIFFFSDLNQKGSGHYNFNERNVSSCHSIQLLAIIAYGSMTVPVFWMSASRAFQSFLYTNKKKKDMVVEMCRVVSFVNLSFKTLKILLPVLHRKFDLGCYFSVNIQRFGHKRESH